MDHLDSLDSAIEEVQNRERARYQQQLDMIQTNYRLKLGALFLSMALVGYCKKSGYDSKIDTQAETIQNLRVSNADLRRSLTENTRRNNITFLQTKILTAWDMARISLGFLTGSNGMDSSDPCHIGILNMTTVPTENDASIAFLSNSINRVFSDNDLANLYNAIISLQHALRIATDFSNSDFDTCPTSRCPTAAERAWATQVATRANFYLTRLIPIYQNLCRANSSCGAISRWPNTRPIQTLTEDQFLFKNN